MNLYCSNIPKKILDLPALRWYLFSKYQLESDKLPPTPAAFHYKVLRAHFVCRIWKQSGYQIMSLPDVTNYGWNLRDGKLIPITTDRPPAPAAIVELCLCKCKTNCISNRCVYKKNDLRCTELCFCTDCQNDECFEDTSYLSDDEEDIW